MSFNIQFFDRITYTTKIAAEQEKVTENRVLESKWRAIKEAI